jgi:serine/threonine protein kinase/tetratricopeptide (TPR) repeat protein
MTERDMFEAALELPPENRAAHLDNVCRGDAALRQRLEALLSKHDRAGSFLEQPAVPGPATIDNPVTERPGTMIGPYKLMEQIGEGGMGLVFVAEQQQPVRRKVALKVIKPGMDTRQVIARFEAERQALALMDHPNISKVHDGGATATGRPYFVMELVKGVAITQFCDDNRLTVRERLDLFGHVSQAVQHAHQKGIIHRDLKPSNVLVTLQDGAPLVKIIDFGVAKAIGQQLTDKTVYTQFAQIIGTPLYMAPEQAALSNVDVDTRSDIYSLGVLLYELLTGTTPFEQERLRHAGYDEIRRIIRDEEPPKPSTRISTLGQAATTISTERQSDPKRLRRLVRGELDWIVMKALEKDRNRRYETASVFAADVQRYLHDEPVQACPPSRRYRLGKWLRKHRAAAGIGVGLALILMALALGLVVNNLMIRREQARTQAANLLLKENLDLSLKALDEIYLKVAEDRLPRDPAAAGENEELLAKALDFYEMFAQRNEADPNVRHEVVKAYLRAAEIHNRTGHADKGKAVLDRAAGVATRLIEEFPAEAEPKRLLADVHLKKGDADLLKGEPVTEDFQRGIELLEPLLATADPSPHCLETLAVLHSELGRSFYRSGDSGQALTHTREAIKLLERAVNETDDLPRKLGFMRGLAIRHVNLGARLMDLFDNEGAIGEERQAIALLTQVNMPGYRSFVIQGLGAAYECLALALWNGGQFGAAESNLNRSLEFWTQLVQDRPRVPGNRTGLARVERLFGKLLLDGWRRLPEALEHCKRSIDILRKLEAESPGVRDNQDLLWQSLKLMGDLLLAEGERDRAAKHYREALVLLEGMVAGNRNNAQHAADLAEFLTFCADPRFRDPARAVSLAQSAVNQIPGTAEFWCFLGVAQYRNGQWQAAIASLNKAKQLHHERDERDWLFLAMAYWQVGDQKTARACFDHPVEIRNCSDWPPAEAARCRAEAAALLKQSGTDRDKQKEKQKASAKTPNG